MGHIDPLETSLLHGDSVGLNNEEVAKCLVWMDSFRHNKRKYFEHLEESLNRHIPSIKKAPILEEKPLLTHL